MKSSYFIASLLFLFTSFHSAAQTTLTGQTISENEVPEVVKSTLIQNFPDAKVSRWKFQKAIGKKGNTASRYVAIFRGVKKQENRARFTPKGDLLYSQKYYTPKNIPQILIPDLQQNFGDYRITSGIFVKLYKTQKEYYRIRLKKGVQITYVYYDSMGNQVDRNKLPKEVSIDQ